MRTELRCVACFLPLTLIVTGLAACGGSGESTLHHRLGHCHRRSDHRSRRAHLPGDDAQGNPQVLQLLIGADGTLTPAGIAARTGATAVGITPSGTTAYLLSSCIDNLCDGQVAPSSIGSNGAFTQAATPTPTGRHENPVAIVFDSLAANAYMLVNLMGVDTDIGRMQPYAIGAEGVLTSHSSGALPITGTAVAESALGSDLYTLSGGPPEEVPVTAQIQHFVMAAGGLRAMAAMPVAGTPTAMALAVPH